MSRRVGKSLIAHRCPAIGTASKGDFAHPTTTVGGRVALLDHLVGAAEDRKRNRDAQRLGSPQVDEQLNFGCLLDR